MRQGCVRCGGGFGGVLQHSLQVSGQGVVLVLVEDDLEEFLSLVERAHGVELGHVLRTKAHVGGRVVEFEGIDHTALHGGDDFATRQLRDGHAHFLQHVGSQADGAVLEAFQVSGFLGW